MIRPQAALRAARRPPAAGRPQCAVKWDRNLKPKLMCIRALKEKRLELSTPNLVHVYSIARSRHALTLRSKGQRSKSQGYKVCCRRGYGYRYDFLGVYFVTIVFFLISDNR